MAEKVKVVKIDTAPAQKSIKDLRNELKELRNTMLSTEQGTEEYNKALVQAAEIQHVLKEQMEQVNASAMDFGQIASNVTNTVGGMVAGFQAAKATMNLFGIENENVLKSLEKMQNLMALTQALPSIDKGVKGFKSLSIAISTATGATSKFGKALISTGLGAIVVALGYLISNFEEISKWLDEITGETDFLGNLSDKILGGINAGWTAIIKSIAAVGSAIKTYITSPFKSVWAAIEAYSSTNGGFADKLKAAGKALKTTFVDEWKGVGNDFKQIGEATVEAYNEGVKKANARRTAESEKERKARLEREKKAAEEEAKAVAEIKKRYASLEEEIKLYNATELEKQLEQLRKEQEKALKTIEDTHKKRLISDEQYEKDKLSIVKHYDKLTQKAKEDSAKKSADEERKKSIELIDTSYKLQQATLQKQYDEKLISEKEFTDRKKELLETYVQDYADNIQFILDTETGLTDEQLLDLTEKVNNARSLLNPKDSEENSLVKGISEAINASALALNDFSDNPAWGNILKNVATLSANWNTLNEQIKKGGKQAFTAYAQIAATALSSVAQMMNGLAAEEDTTNKEGFESSKKLQIAGATMSMLSGIVSAWASAMQLGPIAGPILGAVLSAMMLATGIAQITKIKQQQFDSGGSTSATNATPNTSAVNSVIAPVQYTQDVQGASIEGAIKDSKVYVTETDITDTQNKVSVTETEARY